MPIKSSAPFRILRSLRNLLSAGVDSLSLAKVRIAGTTVGKNCKIASQGKWQVNNSARIIVSDDATIHQNFRIQADANAQIIIGANVVFEEGARLAARRGAKIVIGDGCWFNHDLSIDAIDEVVIGNGSIFGPYCYINDSNHKIGKNDSLHDLESSPLSIGAGVWLGVGVTVLKDAHIGEGAIVGARAVVTKPVPAYEIWAGIPARKIGMRD